MINCYTRPTSTLAGGGAVVGYAVTPSVCLRCRSHTDRAGSLDHQNLVCINYHMFVEHNALLGDYTVSGH